MADIFSATKRSEIMSRIRSTGTAPETRLYPLVRETLGRRWRVDRNVRVLPGQPDIVIPSLHIALFADGCFYHGCPQHGQKPKSNLAYWIPKLKRNRERDAVSRRALRRMGFSIWSFWEHDLKGKQLERTHKLLRHRLEARVAAYRKARKPGDRKQ